jgi:hypothetical protein
MAHSHETETIDRIIQLHLFSGIYQKKDGYITVLMYNKHITQKHRVVLPANLTRRTLAQICCCE